MAVPACFSLLKGFQKGGSGPVKRNREENKDGNFEKYSLIHLFIQALFYGGPTVCHALGQLLWSSCCVQNTQASFQHVVEGVTGCKSGRKPHPHPPGERLGVLGVSSWAESSSLHLGASWHVPFRVVFFFFKLSAAYDGSPATKSLVRLLSVGNTPATHQQFSLWCLLAHPRVVVKLIF